MYHLTECGKICRRRVFTGEPLTLISFLLDPGMLPFTGALLFVAGLLIIELVMSLLGASLMGDAGGDAEFDVDAGVDGFDGVDGADSLDVADLDSAEAFDLEGIEGAGATSGGIASWLGFGQVPFVLWLAGTLTAFGLVGYGVQSAASGVFGGLLPWALAVPLSVIPALWLGRGFARVLGRMVPKTESSAISRRSLGNRRGVIAQGTARRGSPAQARVRDGYGNWHYVRVEPVDDGVEIPQGTEVLIRGGRGAILGAIPLDDVPPRVSP